ncbi:hypothetical protein PVL30_000058 [Lodderomyces elongisporus]|uniref:uncharacterized protein n=1 Tax=Lodderomyces elongisporus TaxID=36914 RepID=UPI002922BCD7|nr:uncharacterized protein PVL30_000058 [Lodderomyces elongisporus]WLF76357.1 hypothetical protein PVL30_000058 [Lodderomyces elongisporus]
MSTTQVKTKSSSEHEQPSTKRSKLTATPTTNPINPDTQISECFKTVTTRLYLSLAPSFVQTPISGIKQQHLDPLIMTYYPAVQGVVLAYTNVKLQTPYDADSNSYLAKIEGSSPFTFFWISVDFLVWSPNVGDVLEGDIYMQTPSHIGLLIHDVFNASIKKHNIPHDWEFQHAQQDEVGEENEGGADEEGATAGTNGGRKFGHWVDAEGNSVDDAKLKFTIKSLYTTGRVVHIDGTLIKPGEERNSQPVYREKSNGKTQIKSKSSAGKHMKFADDDDDDAYTRQTGEDGEPVVEVKDVEEMPAYLSETVESEDNQVVNKSDSDEVESD